jgi:hypothetical protein
MPHSLPDVLARHADLPCLRHPAIRSALDAGRFTVHISGPHPNLLELLGIYEVRAKHLECVPGGYARQLRQSILSFCNALARQPSDSQVAATSVNLDNGVIIDMWERVDTRELLGCNVGYDHRIMTEPDWERVWGAGLPQP